MRKQLLSIFLFLMIVSCPGFVSVFAETESEDEAPPQTSSGIELPMDDADYPEGHFETRLWPEIVIREVEIDHLKYLASSPETPAEDRAMFLEVVNSLSFRSQLNGPGF